MKNVVAGTRNPTKLAALRGLLAGVVTVSAPPEYGSPPDEEDGPTVPAVALEKAKVWSGWLRDRGVADPVVVTDGGLLVPGLGPAWNPVRTRRSAGPAATPLDLARSLLLRCADLSGDNRRIGWIEAAAVVFPGEEPTAFVAESPPGLLAETLWEGDYADSDGFWVPGIWCCPEFGLRRLIDLSPQERASRLDHWTVLGGDLRRYLRGEIDPD